jgi:hypothetical protein
VGGSVRFGFYNLLLGILCGWLTGAAADSANPNDGEHLTEQALVLIQTEAGQGSGFICELNGTNYIITNTHVLENSRSFNFKTLQGKSLKPLRLELAARQDLARVMIAESNVTALALAGNDIHLGDPVRVLGNSLGMNAATELTGFVMAIGPELVEVSAGFVPGNSGSPILTEDSRVIGVATFVKKENPKKATVLGTRFAKPRRFGYRLTQNIEWIPISPSAFYDQSSVLGDIQTLTQDLVSLENVMDESQSDLASGVRMFAADARNDRFASRYRNKDYPRQLGAFASAFADYLKSKDAGFSDQSHAARTSRQQMEMALRQLVSLPLKSLKATRWSTPAFEERAQEAIDSFGIWEGRIKELPTR